MKDIVFPVFARPALLVVLSQPRLRLSLSGQASCQRVGPRPERCTVCACRLRPAHPPPLQPAALSNVDRLVQAQIDERLSVSTRRRPTDTEGRAELSAVLAK